MPSNGAAERGKAEPRSQLRSKRNPMQMPTFPRACVWTLLLASAVAPTLTGCAMFQPQEKVVPVSDTRSFKPISWRCEDTPQTRKQIVAHNSVLDSLKRNKRVIYSDDCPEGKPTS